MSLCPLPAGRAVVPPRSTAQPGSGKSPGRHSPRGARLSPRQALGAKMRPQTSGSSLAPRCAPLRGAVRGRCPRCCRRRDRRRDGASRRSCRRGPGCGREARRGAERHLGDRRWHPDSEAPRAGSHGARGWQGQRVTATPRACVVPSRRRAHIRAQTFNCSRGGGRGTI